MMTQYETDIRRVIKWLHNEAVYLPHYIENKAAWYDENDEKFWQDWFKNVFDIRTANAFGLIVWCVILGVPTSLFDARPQSHPFAFGQTRQNFVGSTGANPSPGGNFIGSNDSIKDLDEIRKMLRMRYAAMIGNGNYQFINKMMNLIFNDGKPWDVSNLEYMYLADSTCQGFEKTQKFLRTDWRGTTEIVIDKESRNYFPQTDVKNFPDQSATVSNLTVAQVPDGINNTRGQRLTGKSKMFQSYTHSPTESVLPPVSERTMVYGVCVRNPTVDNPKYTHARVDVYESNRAFGPNNRYDGTQNRISSDVIDLRPKLGGVQTMRDGLMVKSVDQTDSPMIWVESAARFTPTGRAACLVVTPCDANGIDTPDMTGAILDVWFPICRSTGDTDAYWSAFHAGSESFGGKWVINGNKLSHVTPTGAPDNFDKLLTTFKVVGVEGHSRTTAGGDTVTPDGVSATASTFTIQPMSVIGSAPAPKTIDYRIGANTEVSSRFLAILRERKNDIMFQHAGIPYTVTRES